MNKKPWQILECICRIIRREGIATSYVEIQDGRTAIFTVLGVTVNVKRSKLLPYQTLLRFGFGVESSCLCRQWKARLVYTTGKGYPKTWVALFQYKIFTPKHWFSVFMLILAKDEWNSKYINEILIYEWGVNRQTRRKEELHSIKIASTSTQIDWPVVSVSVCLSSYLSSSYFRL